MGYWYCSMAVFGCEVLVMKRDLFNSKTPEHERQMGMARNVAQLKDKQSKRQQVHLLCRSLIRSIRGK
jgi:hypothetical protein